MIGIISVVQDITESKRAQKLLTTLTVKAKEVEVLQRIDQLRKDLIATVSHELRNPLASIKGYISTLLQPDVSWEPELQREFLKIADREAERLNRLVGDLLTLSQLESGVVRLEREPIDLARTLGEMEHHLGPLASGRSLQIELPEDLPLVLADRHRLSQVAQQPGEQRGQILGGRDQGLHWGRSEGPAGGGQGNGPGTRNTHRPAGEDIRALPPGGR